VIPILFRGPIGMIKVEELPRDVEFYLEGKFSYDRFKEQSAKLNEIVLRKPIYIPYGDYDVELRRARQLGETALTFVKDIIFQRKFIIAEDSPTHVLAVTEEDLSVFPVKIRSEPSGADVFVDGKLVGKTPFEGPFPLGEHKLVLRKEGYFEHSETLKMDINTPYLANVTLKTSVAGAHINNARLAMNRAMYQEAINELAEALNSQPAPSEVALARHLLGTCYLKLNDVQRAMGYFEQAKEHEDWRHPAMLGMVHGHAMMNQMDRALPLLVEVLLKTEDEEVKKEANDLFQKISPFRSVIYVYSEPAGAQVVVNDNPVAQKTPVILHELPLGNYRIRVEKPGYLPTELNLSLSVNEFNPVIVKLRPIPE
jgi:tetratricopeptide (TPR) repeat protein